jgi:hypothetical protein
MTTLGINCGASNITVAMVRNTGDTSKGSSYPLGGLQPGVGKEKHSPVSKGCKITKCQQ